MTAHTPDAAKNWKAIGEHAAAQALGKTRFYSAYRVRVAMAHREYGME